MINNPNARDLTAHLGGKWHGAYGTARCPAHDDRNPSLSIRDGAGGRLLMHCHAGCAFADILDAAGVTVGEYRAPDPVEVVRREAEQAREAMKRERQALAIWHESRPIEGTVAETYLRRRGINCDLPDTLRFHPKCWHGPTAKRLPAMIALVASANLGGAAVHRTYLRADGSGKAASAPAKMMLGGCLGGAVGLTDGQQGSLTIAEGIETALSLACGLLPDRPAIWAALSASGMAGLQLPLFPGRLTIATDGDPAGHEAGHKLATRAHALGWQVSMLPAPEGHDWNDVLRAGVKGGAA